MSQYVSTNRLRTHMAGGVCGRAGTAADASGLYAITHKLGTPTIFGAVMETHTVTTTAQFTKTCVVRLSGTALVVRVMSTNGSVVQVSATAAFRWFAME